MDLPKDVTSPYSASSRRTGQSSDYDSSTESDEDDLKPAAIDFDEDVRLAVALQQEEFLAQERMFHKASKDETSLNCDVDELLALSLEYADDDDDEETWVAKFASLSETKYVSDDDVDEFDEKRQAQIDADAAFAKAMAETYEPLDGETRKLVEEFEKEAMFLTISGRATLFVQAVLELATKTEATLPAIMQAKIRAVNRDDMVYFAERLLKAQESLEEQGRDTSVDVGYHYTNSEECMTRIRVDGLMTLAERDAAGIPRVFNGASYGDGIYTANNPSSYSGYGPIGLLVARLKGTTTKTTGTPADQANSVIGRAGAADEILVLRNSRHCLPLIEYETALASSHKALLESLEQDLQALISKYMLVMAKSSLDQGLAKTSFPSVKIAAFNLPDNLTYTAPPMLSIDPISATTPAGSSTDECPICLATLSQSVVSLDYCGHKFHRECLLQSARAGQRSCAYCRKLFQEPQGLCPSGTLTVSYSSSQTCSGFAAGVITLDYKVPNGVQQSYHPSPGVSFSGATRQAFLPDNREGRELLKRLKYALPEVLHLLSVQACRATALSGAHMAFQTMLDNCHCELDYLGVPAADAFR